MLGVRSAAYAPSQLEFRRPVASQAYPIGTTPDLTTHRGWPSRASNQANRGEIPGYFGTLPTIFRDIAGIFDPGTCAPIYLDWQSGEPSPRRDSILGSPIVLILTNFVCLLPNPI